MLFSNIWSPAACLPLTPEATQDGKSTWCAKCPCPRREEHGGCRVPRKTESAPGITSGKNGNLPAWVATNSDPSAWIQRTADLTEGGKLGSFVHSVTSEHKAKPAFHSEILLECHPGGAWKREAWETAERPCTREKTCLWHVSAWHLSAVGSSLCYSHWPPMHFMALDQAAPCSWNTASLLPQVAKSSQSLGSNFPPCNCPSPPSSQKQFLLQFIRYLLQSRGSSNTLTCA